METQTYNSVTTVNNYLCQGNLPGKVNTHKRNIFHQKPYSCADMGRAKWV